MRVLVSWPSALVAMTGILLLSGCSGAPGRIASRERAAVPIVYGNGSSISSAGQSGWTTPPAGGSVQPAPVPVTSTWSAPPPPPPASAAPVVSATPYTTTYVPSTTSYATQPCAPCAPPPAAPARCWSGCGLPCSDGLSQWHVRGVLGYAFYEGDDAPSECLYWGFDVGRTFCGCWGLDLFYRYHAGRFDRDGGTITKDGGGFNEIGVKATYERSFGKSRFYWYAGLGPEYFWTNDFINDDSGFGIFAELGVGYVINQSFRVRAGLDFHALDTDVGRRNPADDGSSRWLYVIAPVVGVEFAF